MVRGINLFSTKTSARLSGRRVDWSLRRRASYGASHRQLSQSVDDIGAEFEPSGWQSAYSTLSAETIHHRSHCVSLGTISHLRLRHEIVEVCKVAMASYSYVVFHQTLCSSSPVVTSVLGVVRHSD